MKTYEVELDSAPDFFLKHYNGRTHAAFCGANSAYACQQGLRADPDPRVQTWFHFENAKGETVVLENQPRNPGHAYAILAALDAAAKTGGQA